MIIFQKKKKHDYVIYVHANKQTLNIHNGIRLFCFKQLSTLKHIYLLHNLLRPSLLMDLLVII